MTGQTWQVRLPLAKPLSMNSRQHWRARARDVQKVRGDALLVLRSARIPRHEKILVELIYYPRDRRKRDADNIVPTLKASCDAIVDAQIVPDDDPAHMVKMMPVIETPDGDPRLVLTITGLVQVAA